MPSGTAWPAAAALFASNLFASTLSSPVDSSVTTIPLSTVPPGTPPALGSMTLDGGGGAAGMEVVRVTDWGSAPYQSPTVLRGQAGTVPQAHSNGASVTTTLSVSAGFLGGDTNASVDLGSNRVLWVFNDFMWATAAGQARSGFPNAHQILAVQTGYDLSTATLAWYPTFDANSRPVSYFRDYDDGNGSPSFRWCGGGLMLDGKLILIGQKVMDNGTGNGNWAVMVDNPAATPDAWNWFDVPMWTAQTVFKDQAGVGHPTGSPQFGLHSIADGGDGHVYLWANMPTAPAGRTSAPLNQTFVARVLRTDAKQGNLQNPQWWSGTYGWSFTQPPQPVTPSNTNVLVQGSEHKRSDSAWQLTGSDDSAHVQYATRTDPTGAFPALANIYAIPNFAQGLNYTVYAHPEQTFSGKGSTDVVISYTPGFPPAGIAASPEAYLPKFIQATGL